MPYSGNIRPGTMRAAYVTCKRQDSLTRVLWLESDKSLLDFNFNFTWCGFVNGVSGHDYPPFDYYCLLASDVEPLEQGWLDILIDELEQSQYAALHSPCAIKHLDGVLSTGVGYWPNPYSWYRRLSLAELFRLPAKGVWGYDEVCDVMGEDIDPEEGCLLPNTGLLLVSRKRFPCLEFPGFNCENRLVWKLTQDTILDSEFYTSGTELAQERVLGYTPGEDWSCVRQVLKGKVARVAEFAPEDWQLGRWAAANKVKIGGTRIIATAHDGSMRFGTNVIWGSQTRDEVNVRGKLGIKT